MIHHTTIIAEAGVNHNGNLDLAKQLVDIAAEAGADLVKFQTFKANRVVIQNALKAEYQLNTAFKDQSQFEMLNQLELTEAMHESLSAYCKKKKLVFFLQHLIFRA